MWFKLNTTFTQSLGTLSELSNSWSITRNLTNYSTTSTVTSVAKNGTYSATFTLNSGCTYSSHSVTMGGAKVNSASTASATAYKYDSSTHTITFSNFKVTGALVITAVATGASSGGSGGTTPPVTPPSGTQITTGSLAGAYLHENTQFYNNGTAYENVLIPDETKTYFVIREIPVQGNKPYQLKNGRACWFLKGDKTLINSTMVNLTSQYTNWEFTTPANCAYLTVAFKYADIQPSNVQLISASWGEPVTTLLKDTGATCLSETGILSQTSNPNTYTEPGAIAGWFTYHLIPVTGGNKYKIENGRLANWYNSSKQFISQVNFNSNAANPSTPDWSHVAPSNAAYLSICVNNNDMAKDAVAMIEYPKV